jgi:hypothetical protein
MSETMTENESAIERESGTIYIVTADLVAQTGRITWEYFFADKAMPSAFQDAIVNLPFGWAWFPNCDKHYVSVNVFKAGEGLFCGGGWEGTGSDWDREHLDNVPSCSLLMTTEVFNFIHERVLTPFGRKYERFHSEQILYTSKRP